MTPAPANLPPIPTARLGRTGITTTRFGLGTASWPLRVPYEQVVDVFRAAFEAGVRHVDTAPLYRTEEIVGRAIAETGRPPGLTVATKACAYKDDIGILYREYSGHTVHRSVERSLQRLRTDRIDVVHIHDVEEDDLPRIGAPDGALKALVDLREQGVIRSLGMATVSLDCLRWAVDTGQFDHIQIYHTHTLLNSSARDTLIPAARARHMGVFNCAPFAGYILQNGPAADAMYNYRPARPEVIEAARRLEAAFAAKGATLLEAAAAYSYQSPDVDVTIVGASSRDKLHERLRPFGTKLTRPDLESMRSLAGGPFPATPRWPRNPINTESPAER